MQLRVQLYWSVALPGKLVAVTVNVGSVVGLQPGVLNVEHTAVLVALIAKVGVGTGLMVTVAVPDFVGSALDVAFTVTFADWPPPGIDIGAV
jgi:hypothetical protein